MSERRVRLAYGHDGLEVDFRAERTTVVEPRRLTLTTSPERLVRTALRNPVAGPPLRDIVRPGLRIAISICDGTRPQPGAAGPDARVCVLPEGPLTLPRAPGSA